MVAGLERVTGDIWIDRKRVTEMEPKDRVSRWYFRTMLSIHMRSVEEKYAGTKSTAYEQSVIEERAEAARIPGVDGSVKRRPRELSGGRQRVAMGRAIVREPAVFLFRRTAL